MREILRTLEPPPEMTVSEWADNFRRLSAESSAEPGRWKTSKAPYQREIMDAISDMRTEKVIVMSAAQVGKTDGMILNPIGYYMQYDPSPMMAMQPTITMGEAFSKDRLDPMLRDTPVLREITGQNDTDDEETVKKKKKRKLRSTVLQKRFPGGHVTIVGANSPSSLASRPVRILFADEIDRYPMTAGNEGDPLALAEKRLTTFWNKKIVEVSTPTVKGISRIEVEYNNSTEEHWNVPCPVCGEYQQYRWANIQFDKNDLSHIYHVCEKCGAVSEEAQWKEASRQGKFVAEHPERPVRGFHLNAMASLFVKWSSIVADFLKAKEELDHGNPELMKVWVNTVLGETWEEEGTQLDYAQIMERREIYACEVPERVKVLTAGVDTQDDRFEVEVVGWGAGMESWGIQYQILYGDLKEETVWRHLDEFLTQTFYKADGTPMQIVRVCMDSGGHFTNQVYAFCAEREKRGVYAIKGRGGDDVPYIQRASKGNREQANLITIGVDTGKSRLFGRLSIAEPGANYCHFPLEGDRGYTDDYFKGLTSERRETRYKNGRAQFVWVVKDGYRRNEPLDCRNYATAAMEIYGTHMLKDRVPVRTNRRGVVSKGIENPMG